MAKYISQRKQTKEQWFNAVVNNAVLFLQTSVGNLESSPRNAIIDLYTAIELFFKARLMKEHWSLILSRPEEANQTKFENGDFHSVYLEQSEKRLVNICGEKFKTEALKNFKALNEHRNQIVHFAHTDFSGKESGVVIEHWASWYYLHDLLTNNWKDIFSDFQNDINKIHNDVNKNIGFLAAKFEAISDDIEIEVKKGSEVIDCPSCSFHSAIVKDKHIWGKDYRCLVCAVEDTKLTEITTKIKCSNCDSLVSYFLNHTCEGCGTELGKEYALEKYTELYKAVDPELRYGEDNPPIAFCHSCYENHPTVVSLEGMWVCVYCEDRGWSALDCENCDSFVTGDINKIQYFACHLCEDEVRDRLKAELDLDSVEE